VAKIPRPKRGRPKGDQNSLRYFPLCLWCGKEFASARPDAKTHSPGCRSALSRYKQKNGCYPLFPFGLPEGAERLSGGK